MWETNFEKFKHRTSTLFLPIEFCVKNEKYPGITPKEYFLYDPNDYDLENKEETEFCMPGKEYPNEGNINNQLQNLGKIQTYIRRYLYMQFLDITENDVVDAESKPKKNLKYPVR